MSTTLNVIEAVPQRPLDTLWRNAERIGKINVEPLMFSRDMYRVRIEFTRASGGRVWAEGRHQDIAIAFDAAIRDAHELGAV